MFNVNGSDRLGGSNGSRSRSGTWIERMARRLGGAVSEMLRIGSEVAHRILRMPWPQGPVLNGEVVARKLGVRNLARRDAGREYPSADATSAPEILQLVHAACERLTRRRSDVRNRFLRRAALRVEELDLADPAPTMDSIVRHFDDVDADALVREAALKLREARAESRSARIALRVIRDVHGLIRHARRPLPRLVTFALLVFVGLFEAFLNGQYLMDASPWGLVAGMLYAGGFAFANVGLSLWCGHLFGRWTFVRPVGVRTFLGWLAIAGFTAIAVTAHVTFVAFRTAAHAASDFSVAVSGAPALLRDDPMFWLNDVGAMTLLAIGITISVASFLKGLFAFGDPVPGYYEATRRLDDALGAEQAILDDAREAIDFAEEAACEDIIAGESAIDEALCQARSLDGRIATALAEQDREDRVHSDAVRQALAIYWAAQRELRDGISPLPTWIDEPVEVDRIDYGIDGSTLLARARAVEANLVRLRDARHASEALQQLADAARQAQQRLNDLLGPSDGDGDAAEPPQLTVVR